MKRYLLILLYFVIITIGFAKTVKENDFLSNLAKWNSFRWEGVVEVNYKELALRKYFIMAKAEQRFRLDVIDGGVFGMNPKPLLTVFMGDSIYVDCVYPEITIAITNILNASQEQITLIKDLHNILAGKYREVNTAKYYGIDSTFFYFNKKNLMLERIDDIPSKMEFRFNYNQNKDIEKITVFDNGKAVLKLYVDKVMYKGFEINPPLVVKPEE